jgi:nucleoside 2-deoxyribosyltransferase
MKELWQMFPVLYLASPYSHPDKAVQLERFHKVCKAAGYFIKRGYAVYSPIVHMHSIVETCAFPAGWAYWQAMDETFLRLCDELWVLCLDGWDVSEGVQAEIAYAEELGMHIRLVAPDEVDV